MASFELERENYENLFLVFFFVGTKLFLNKTLPLINFCLQSFKRVSTSSCFLCKRCSQRPILNFAPRGDLFPGVNFVPWG
jgi:hypothetical protein